MLCGVYNLSGGSADELDGVLGRLRAAAGKEATIRGALAIASWGPAATMAELDGVTCALDGRLYDRDPRRRQAADRASDAKTVALAYRRGGEDWLLGLRGRFSLALWDVDARTGVLACDLLAVNQLYVHRGLGGVVFASELHGLLSVLAASPGPDPIVFPRWLAGGECPPGRTLYEGVSRLGPGESLRLTRGHAEPRTYWRPRYEGTMRAGREELLEGLREALLRAHRQRLAPDLTGVILSGGVDSSIVTAIAERAAEPPARLRTYSAVFPEAPYDESDKIRRLTGALGVQRELLRLQPQGTVAQALRFTQRWKMPLTGIGAIIDIAAVTEAAADGAAIVVNGQTGDELFGFSPYLISDRLRRGRLLSAVGLTDRWPGGTSTTPSHKLRILRQALKGAAPRGLSRLARIARDGSATDAPWLLPHVRAQQAALDDRWAWKELGSGPLWWRSLADTLVYGPHRELRLDYLRRRADAAGIADETPLYDPDLIRFCLSLPPELAFSSGVDRPFAREAMRGLLPDEVRMQQLKADFTPFCHEALVGADAAGISRFLESPRAEIGAYVDLDWVRRSWAALRSRPGTHEGLGVIWLLAATECWLQSHAGGGMLDEMLADPAIPEMKVCREPAAAN